MMKRTYLSLAALMLAGTLAGAADLGAAPLQPLTEGDVTYVSGGFGMDERQELDAAAKDYNLKLVFAGKGSGAYLADVGVSIATMQGRKILEAVSNGPWFLARLPAGRYRITATAEGQARVQSARVGDGRLTQLHFYWQVAK